MQVQFLFLFPSLAIQWEKTAERVEAPVSWEEPDGTGMGERSFLLVIVAGTGCLTSDLISKLFNQLWVLLLHLLSELLARLDETGQVIL